MAFLASILAQSDTNLLYWVVGTSSSSFWSSSSCC